MILIVWIEFQCAYRCGCLNIFNNDKYCKFLFDLIYRAEHRFRDLEFECAFCTDFIITANIDLLAKIQVILWLYALVQIISTDSYSDAMLTLNVDHMQCIAVLFLINFLILEKERVEIKQLWFTMLNLSYLVNVLLDLNRRLFRPSNKFHCISWYTIIRFYSDVNTVGKVRDDLLALECKLSVGHVFVWLGAVRFCTFSVKIKSNTHIAIETSKFKHILFKFYLAICCKVHMIISYLLGL